MRVTGSGEIGVVRGEGQGEVLVLICDSRFDFVVFALFVLIFVEMGCLMTDDW